MRGKINTSGGSAGKLNVYTQMTEPSKKEGIWIQCDSKYDGVEIPKCDNKGFYLLQEYDFPDNSITRGITAVIGTDIWISCDTTGFVKYDTLTNKYTDVGTNNSIYYGTTASVGTDIYIVGEGSSHVGLFKYNTLTGEETYMKTVPYNFNGGCVGTIGTDLYLFGPGKNTYKYNTLTDTYTKLKDIPYNFTNECLVVIGTDIYLFFNDTSTKYCYKYNTTNNTYTKLKNIPFNFWLGSVANIKEYIYMISSYDNYIYNITTNTYTKMEYFPRCVIDADINIIGTSMYVLGDIYNDCAFKYTPFDSIEVDEYKEDTIYIASGKNYIAKLIGTSKMAFNDIWLYKNNKLQEYPTYVGNGTSWTKIKN